MTRNDVNGNPGYFLFDQLDPADYFIEFILPGGATFTTQGGSGSDPIDSDADPSDGRTEVFSLAGGQYDPTWQAGIVLETGSLTLGDRVWHDANNDGDYDPFDGELGIDNVVVNLYIDTDGSGDYTPGVDQFRATTTTYTNSGERGYYEFTELPEGDYIVQITPKNFEPGQALDGMSSSTGNGVAPDPDNDTDNDDNGEPLADYGVVSQSITISNTLEPTSEDGDNNTNMTVDFGFYIEPAAIGNYVWHDENHDGIQDVGESAIEGVTITLTITYPNGATVVLTDVTDSSGHYSFDSLLENENYNGEPPTYVISAETPAGYRPTVVNASGATSHNDSNDPSGTTAQPNPGEINVSAGVTTTIASYDFGFWQPLAIGNFLWNDTNGATPNNGIFEPATESGFDGVTLQLYQDDGDGVFNILSDTLAATTVTDNGFYMFSDLEPSNYFIHVPNTEFLSGGGLYDNAAGKAYDSVTNSSTPTDDTADHDAGENGIDAPDAGTTGVTTNMIALGRSAEPTGELQSSPDGYNDNNANLTVDLAFFLLEPTAVQLSTLNSAAGSLVWFFLGWVFGLGFATRHLLWQRR